MTSHHDDKSLELERISAEFKDRASTTRIPADRYSAFSEANLLHMQSLERNLLALLKREKMTMLLDKSILDVGCGSGTYLRRFIDYGARPGNLSGIDLVPDRIELARTLNPAIHWSQGSAHELPYETATFDLVTSFVMFTSILDQALRKQIAREMWRVLKPGGLIVCHDFVYNNPRNAAVRGFAVPQLREVFSRPGARFRVRRIFLAPPLARVVAPRSRWLADSLEQVVLLNTHFIAAIRVDSLAK
jgi:ubiquinone/menaquinone biosynthesis C-methylase UbiE